MSDYYDRGVAFPDGSCSHGHADWRYSCPHYHVTETGVPVPREDPRQAADRHFGGKEGA